MTTRGYFKESASDRTHRGTTSASDHIQETIDPHRERLAMTGEIAAQVMHELRGYLTGISTLVDYLEEAPAKEESLRLIRREIEEASTLISSLVDFARPDSEAEIVSVDDVVEDALALHALRRKNGSVPIIAELSQERAAVRVGPRSLKQVLLNLIENARHAVEAKGSGRIMVRTSCDAQNVYMEISDEGTGVPEHFLDRIFQPFFTTKSAPLGSGLGLSIVSSIVQNSGGEISVRSVPDEGTSFLLSFRRVD